MIVKNPIGLIGDVLGTFPVLQQLNKDHDSFSVIVHEDAKWLYDLVPEINICTCPKWDKELNLSGAFTMSHQQGCYMVQSHYPFMGYPIPASPIKAKLTVQEVDVPVYDYILAPFGRSAPESQKLELSKWLELMNLMPDKSFLVIGNSKHDQEFEVPDNGYFGFDLSAHQLCNVLLKARSGCISIVTGISHLCYHLSVKNYLLTNQTGMTWGENPEAVCLRDHIPTLKAQTVYDLLSKER